MLDSKQSFLARPAAERRAILAKQAKEMESHYNATRKERTRRQGGSVFDYSAGEMDSPSSDSEKQDAEEEDS